ncbi:hypothetical protein LWI29_011288 [Acer saccharum]|uniref:Uncharacterized protein n=1 Tax=Acer saccharum TaxID=4024 RepID=A0AA39SPE3_ACESA|nr:hypothetical protein LWI29_011288 [Acer saccharum]
MLSLEPFSEDQGRSAVQPVRDPANQLPCALRVYWPVDSHTCQTPWSVFQDGPNGELAGRCQERRCTGHAVRRALPATIAATTRIASPHPLPSRQFQALFDSLFKVLFIFPSRYLFAIGLSPVFSLGRNLPPDLGCIPKQPDSQTAPRDATGSGRDGAFTLSAPLSRGLGPGPPLRTLLQTTIRTPKALDSQAGLFPVRSPLLGESW